MVYRQEENKEVFLARAFAQNLETETIALDEAKASSKKVREAGQTVSNRSILNEIRDRDLFTPPDKKTRKQRQKEEQAKLTAPKKLSNANSQHSKPFSSDRVSQAEDFDEIERGSAPTASRQAQVSFEEEEEISPAESETQRVEVLDYEVNLPSTDRIHHFIAFDSLSS